MPVVLGLVGLVLGLGLGGGGYYFLFHLLHFGAALPLAAVIGAIAAIYSAVAFAVGIYRLGFFSVLGYLLDASWSLLNSFVGLVGWLPICMISGANFDPPNPDSQRSGTFVYLSNPRGGGYDATTIGTVIAGGWSSHEETHVWQARLFGPLYLPVYILNLLLNLVFRFFTFDFSNYAEEAYRRICFEDWAYAAGEASGSRIHWDHWILWLMVTSIYIAFVVFTIVGIVLHKMLLIIIGAVGLALYSIVRAFLPGAR